MAFFSIGRLMRKKDSKQEVSTGIEDSRTSNNESSTSNENWDKSGQPTDNNKKSARLFHSSSKKKKVNSASKLRISTVPPTSEKYPTRPGTTVKVVKRVPIIDDSGSPKAGRTYRPPSPPIFRTDSKSSVVPRRSKRYGQSEISIADIRHRSSKRISKLVAKLEEEKERDIEMEKERVLSLDSSDIKVRYSFRESTLTKLQEVIDESNDTPWKRIRLMSSPFPRYRHIASTYATSDNKIFVMGGLHGQLVYGDTWCLQANQDCTDFSTRVIDLSINTPPPRVGHAATLCGNALVVFGGDTHKLTTDGLLDDDLYLFNVDSHKWTVPRPIGTRPLGRYGHQICVIATSTRHAKLYLFGGQLDDNYFNDLAMYDLKDFRNPHSRWEFFRPKGTNPPPLTNHTMVTYDYKLWVFGGSSRGQLMNELYVYFPEENEWKHVVTTGEKPKPLQEHSATMFHNLMCVFGGKTEDDEYQNDLYFLNLYTMKWYKLPSFEGFAPLPRSGHSMTLMQSEKLLIVGGDKNDFLASDNTTSLLSEADQGNGVAIYTLDLSHLNDYCPGVFSVENPVDLQSSTPERNSTQIVKQGSPPKEPEILTPYLQHVRKLNRLLTVNNGESTLPHTPTGKITYTSSELLKTFKGKQRDNKTEEEQKFLTSPNISLESEPHSAINSDISCNSGTSGHVSVFEDSISMGNLGHTTGQNSDESIVESKEAKNPFITNKGYEFPESVIQINQHVEKASKDVSPDIQNTIRVSEDTVKLLQNDLNELKALESANNDSANGRIAQLKLQISRIKATQSESPDRARYIKELNEKCDILEREKVALHGKIQKLNVLLTYSDHHIRANSKPSRDPHNDVPKLSSNESIIADDSQIKVNHKEYEDKELRDIVVMGSQSNDIITEHKKESPSKPQENNTRVYSEQAPVTPSQKVVSKHPESVTELQVTPRKSPDSKRRKRNSIRRTTRIVQSQKHKQVIDEITKQLDMLTRDSNELAVHVLDEIYYDIECKAKCDGGDFLSSTRLDGTGVTI